MNTNIKHLTASIHCIGRDWAAYVKTDTHDIGFGAGATASAAFEAALADAKFYAGFARLARAVAGSA